MPAENRAREHGAPPSAPEKTGVPADGSQDGSHESAKEAAKDASAGVSMRALLASCAAADAVSTPPSDVETPVDAARGVHSADGERPGTVSHDAPARAAGRAARPGRDAA